MNGPETPSSSGSSRALPYRPSLDGLRGVAILMVVAYHDRVLVGGFVGVNLFFVLSGFLITTILLREHQTSGTIHLGNFYARRLLRLAPALVVFVSLTYAVTHWLQPGLADWLRGRWALAALGYVSNLLIAFGREYPLGRVSITWSLAQEEQFYLLWPLTLRFLLRRGQSRKAVACLIGLLITASLAMRYFLLARHAEDPDLWLRVYFGPDTRAEDLLWGCLLAFLFDGNPTGRLARGSAAGGLLGVAVLASLAASRQIIHYVHSPLLFSLGAFASVLAVVGALGPGLLRRVLEWPILVWIGQLSYSLYLWHATSADFLTHEGPVRKHALMLALAVASHYLVERPVLGFNRRLGALSRPHPHVFTRGLPGTTTIRSASLRLAVGLLAAALAGLLTYVRLTGASVPLLELDPLVQARERTQDGDYPGAVVQYRRAVERDVGDGAIFVELAGALARAGDPLGALEARREAVTRKPGDPERQTALGRALLAVKRPEEAAAAFRQSLTLDDNQADAHLGLGRIALDRSDLDLAVGELSRAAALRPTDPNIHTELGVAHALAGRFDDAVQHFSTSLRLKADPSVAENLRKALADRARALAR